MRSVGGITSDPQQNVRLSEIRSAVMSALDLCRDGSDAYACLVRQVSSWVPCDAVAIAEEVNDALMIVEASEAGLRGRSLTRPDQWDALFNRKSGVPVACLFPIRLASASSDQPEPTDFTALAAPICIGNGRRLALLCISREGTATFRPADRESLASVAAIGSVALAPFGSGESIHGPAAADHRCHMLASAVDALPDAIAVMDDQFRFIYVNRAHLDLFGFASVDEVLGKPDLILYSPSQFESIVKVVRPMVLENGAWRGELLATGQAGHCLRQDVVLTRIHGGYLRVARDAGGGHPVASEVARAAHQQAAISAIAPSIAHDFNNLASVITGSAQLIKQLSNETSGMQRHADRIIEAGTKAARLVLHLFELMGPDDTRNTIDLREPVVHALGVARYALGSRLCLASDLSARPVLAEVTLKEFMHLTMDLVIAARDTLADNAGEISVQLDTVPGSEVQAEPCALSLGAVVPGIDYARLRVAAAGRGNSLEAVSSVLDLSLTDMDLSSARIGLGFVWEAISRAGGALRVSSKPDAGAVFEALWPRANQPLAGNPDPGKADPDGLQNATILVVDDVSDVGDVISAMLEGTGASVATCTDPEDVLAALADDPGAWTLLVTDFDMPRMDGAELTRKCRALRPDMPVLLCTALPHRAHQIAGKTLFDGILVKPFTREDLISATATAVGQRGTEGRQRQ